jgi:hypothetical protein
VNDDEERKRSADWAAAISRSLTPENRAGFCIVCGAVTRFKHPIALLWFCGQHQPKD